MHYMSNYINECLVCEAMSYVVEEDIHAGHTYKVYECEKCGFQWEIVEIGNGQRSV